MSATYPGRPFESWDPVEGYKRWDQAGTIVETRPTLTPTELDAYNVFLATPAREATRLTLLAQARTAKATNDTFLASSPPAYPLSTAAQQALVAQTVALTRQVNALIRLVVASDLLDP